MDEGVNSTAGEDLIKYKYIFFQDNFIILLQELRNAFDRFSPPLMLTGAVAAGKPTVDAAYHVQQMGELFDQVHLMSYDFHGAWENTTHHNAPLCGLPTDVDDMAYFNVVRTSGPMEDRSQEIQWRTKRCSRDMLSTRLAISLCENIIMYLSISMRSLV